MRSRCPSSLAIALVVTLLAACGDGGVPNTTSCAGDRSACLFGTVHADPFVGTSSGFKASLYRAFPSGTALAERSQQVANDRTWAFGGLAAWAHYYVVIEPGFPARGVPSKTVATRIGPLAVPNASALPVDVQVKPAELDVLQGSLSGAPQQVQAASARLFDVTTGEAIGSGATVSIIIGATSAPLAWTQSASAYEVTFTAPPSASSTYQIVASPKSGAPQTTYNLVADALELAGSIASPPSGATVAAGKDLTVTWSVLATADYEIVDLYQKTNGSWSRVYTSPEPAASDKASETIPAASVAQPGNYLLNVAFAKANCPPTADGCVEANTVANELLTVQ